MCARNRAGLKSVLGMVMSSVYEFLSLKPFGLWNSYVNGGFAMEVVAGLCYDRLRSRMVHNRMVCGLMMNISFGYFRGRGKRVVCISCGIFFFLVFLRICFFFYTTFFHW